MPSVRFQRRFYMDGRMYGPGVEDVPQSAIDGNRLPSTAEVLNAAASAKAAKAKADREAADKNPQVAISQIAKNKAKPSGFNAAMKAVAKENRNE
jgi:hypothetical protein